MLEFSLPLPRSDPLYSASLSLVGTSQRGPSKDENVLVFSTTKTRKFCTLRRYVHAGREKGVGVVAVDSLFKLALIHDMAEGMQAAWWLLQTGLPVLETIPMFIRGSLCVSLGPLDFWSWPFAPHRVLPCLPPTLCQPGTSLPL